MRDLILETCPVISRTAAPPSPTRGEKSRDPQQKISRAPASNHETSTRPCELTLFSSRYSR